MENELIESVNLVDVKGIPSFIFATRELEALKSLFIRFPITILTIDVGTFRQMPLSPEIVIPDDASLRIEFSLDDIHAGQLLWDMYIDGEKRGQMANLNLKTKSITLGIRDLSTGQIHFIPGNQTPYILDWSGSVGLIQSLRNVYLQSGRGWEKNNAYQIISEVLEEIKRLGGYVTTLHASIGLIYRDLGEFDKATPLYTEEIKGAHRPDGTFATSAMLGFNNLAVIYKKEGAFDKALLNFQFALALNPNYFEALVSIAGLIPDMNQALVYLGRAFRVQSRHPIWNTMLHNMASAYEEDPQRLYDLIFAEAEKADLGAPLVDKEILKRIKFI